MRIALIALNLRRGGLERVVMMLAGGLRVRGHQAKVFAFQPPMEYEDLRARMGVEVAQYAESPTEAFWASVPEYSSWLRWEMDMWRPDAVLIFGGQAAILSAAARIHHAIYCAQNSRGVHWASRRPGHVVLAEVEKLAFRCFSWNLIACSEAARVAYIERFSFEGARSGVVWNAVDVERCRQAREAAKVVPGRIVMVGTLYEQKNYPLAIEAFALLWHGGEAKELIIVGDGPDRKSIERLTYQAGVANNVQFEGRRPDPEQYIATAEVFWLTSRWEGFGLVLGEAMACGTPVVATPVPGVREWIRSGVNGLLATSESAAGMAEATKTLLKSEELKMTLREGGIRFAEAQLTGEAMVIKYEEMIVTTTTDRM